MYHVCEHGLGTGLNEFKTSRYSTILGVGRHAGSLVLWTQEWDGDETITRRFRIVETNKHYSDEQELSMNYIGTVVWHDEAYHVFELLESP